jgi:hypothetical protein
MLRIVTDLIAGESDRCMSESSVGLPMLSRKRCPETCIPLDFSSLERKNDGRQSSGAADLSSHEGYRRYSYIVHINRAITTFWHVRIARFLATARVILRIGPDEYLPKVIQQCITVLAG